MIKSFLATGRRMLAVKQTNILSAAVMMMIMMLFSRLLGLWRARLMAQYFFGESAWLLDTYFAAFRVPDLIFQLIVIGALSASFIPVFSSHYHKHPEDSWRVATGTINLVMSFLVLVVGLVLIFTAPISRVVGVGFTEVQLRLMVNLTRIMLVAQLFFGLSAFLTGILQSFQYFIMPALAPIVYNLGIIFGIVVLSPSIGIYGPAVGVVMGACLHMMVQLPLAMRLGFRFRRGFFWHHKKVRIIIRLMVPRTLSLAVSQLEITLSVMLASLLQTGALTVITFGQMLINLPIGLFGVTIGQASLPALSIQADQASKKAFANTLTQSLLHITYLVMPASVILLVLRIPLVRLVFGSSQFPWQATLLTGKVVAILSLSIIIQALIQLLVRSFYALHDTRTPLVVSIASVGVNLGLAVGLAFRVHLGVVGLAWAQTLSAWTMGVMLLYLLHRQLKELRFLEILRPATPIGVASLMTAVFLYLPMKLLDRFIFDTTRVMPLVLLTAIVTTMGLLIYLSLSYILGIPQYFSFVQIIKKRLDKWQTVMKTTPEVIDTASEQTSV